MHFGFGGFSGFGGFGMILFWVIFIAAILLLVKLFTTSFHHDRKESNSPMDVLKRRYASGEINHDEYERIRHDIAGKL